MHAAPERWTIRSWNGWGKPRGGIPQLDRSDRHDDTRRTNDDADWRAAFNPALVRSRSVALSNSANAPTKGRTHRRTPPRNSRLSSSPRFERWFPGVTKPLPTLLDCSRSTPRPSRGYWRERIRGGSAMPNSSQSSTPDNLQSDNWAMSTRQNTPSLLCADEMKRARSKR